MTRKHMEAGEHSAQRQDQIQPLKNQSRFVYKGGIYQLVGEATRVLI